MNRIPMRRVAVVLAATAAFATIGAASAVAAWRTPSSTADVPARAAALAAGGAPSVSVSGTAITVTWAAAAPVGGVVVKAYRVIRYGPAGQRHEPTGGCAGAQQGTRCIETAVPRGVWRYTVRVMQGADWIGPESQPSKPAVVAPPEFADESARQKGRAGGNGRVDEFPCTVIGRVHEHGDESERCPLRQRKRRRTGYFSDALGSAPLRRRRRAGRERCRPRSVPAPRAAGRAAARR